MTAIEVKKLESLQQYETLKSQHSLLLLNFWSTWAPPCEQMNQIFNNLSQKFPQFLFLMVDAEEQYEVSDLFDIESVPTFVLVRDGKEVERVSGANAPLLTQMVEKHSNLSVVKNEQQPKVLSDFEKLLNEHSVILFVNSENDSEIKDFQQTLSQSALGALKIQVINEEWKKDLLKLSGSQQLPQLFVKQKPVGSLDQLKKLISILQQPQTNDLDQRLHQLINQYALMIFIKGSPTEPRCGFSRQLVTLLDDLHVDYQHFDILKDEEVRQGLKTYSDWPTFPQVYWKGELLGGLDIVKEMIQNGEFQQMVGSQ